MTFDAQRYERLKQQAEKTKREQGRADGALDGILVQLQEEFGCESLEEGRSVLAKLEREAERTAAAFREELDKLEAERGGLLDES